MSRLPIGSLLLLLTLALEPHRAAAQAPVPPRAKATNRPAASLVFAPQPRSNSGRAVIVDHRYVVVIPAAQPTRGPAPAPPSDPTQPTYQRLTADAYPWGWFGTRGPSAGGFRVRSRPDQPPDRTLQAPR